MTATEELSDYAANQRFENLPPSVVKMAKSVTLDLLGAALAAREYLPTKKMLGYIAAQGGGPVATVIGSNIRTSTANAALANGTMAADVELDDVHPAANLHASSVFVPALLATGEARGVSGKEWIVGLVVAYDVATRISEALDPDIQVEKGFHPTAVSGVFGAAAGVARILSLGATGVAQTIGLAGCQASGLITWKLDLLHFAKSFQSGMAARNAVVAAELVASGFLGPEDTLDASTNIFTPFSTREDLAPLTADLGVKYGIEGTGFKFFNCCRAIHSPLESMFDLLDKHEIENDDIETVTVWLPRSMSPVVDDNELLTHNLQYVMAVALVDRRVGPDQVIEDRRAEPAVTDLKRRVHLLADDELEKLYPQHYPSRIKIVTKSKGEFEVQRDDPLGNPDTPASPAQLEQKFRALVAGIPTPGVAQRLVDAVNHLESLDSVADLAAITRVDR